MCLIFGEGTRDCRRLDREDSMVLSCKRDWFRSRYPDDPLLLGFSSRCVHRLLTVTYPFFLDLFHWELSWLVTKDRLLFGFSFQILFHPRSILGLCIQTKILLICNIDADSRHHYKMHSCFTAKPLPHSLIYLYLFPHHHFHLLWHLWTSNSKRPLLPSMV